MAGIKFVHNDDQEVKLNGTPNIPFKKSKKLSSMDGSQVLYYIDVETAFKMKLDTFCDFTQKHPQTESYVLITVPIERV
jgi:hypothetical protein|tara:strand:- start:481 stop:717 length:237 start_codon:yes stop_codon:yes gene_type:complete